MKTYIIKQVSEKANIHSINSNLYDRNIKFSKGCKYAVVLADYYGGKGYTTHKTKIATINKSNRMKDYSHSIIDINGNSYDDVYGELIKQTLKKENACQKYTK